MVGTHFGCLYLHSRSFRHYTKFMTIGEGGCGWNEKSRPSGSAPSEPQQSDTVSAVLQTLHQCTSPSYSQFSHRSWPRPQDTWTSVHGAATRSSCKLLGFIYPEQLQSSLLFQSVITIERVAQVDLVSQGVAELNANKLSVPGSLDVLLSIAFRVGIGFKWELSPNGIFSCEEEFRRI